MSNSIDQKSCRLKELAFNLKSQLMEISALKIVWGNALEKLNLRSMFPVNILKRFAIGWYFN